MQTGGVGGRGKITWDQLGHLTEVELLNEACRTPLAEIFRIVANFFSYFNFL